MKETDRHVVASGWAPRGSIIALCMRLASHARQLGLSVVRVKRSKTVYSQSHYLTVRDSDGHVWSMRISDHEISCPHFRHHFELITPDGRLGEDWAQESLAIIAGGGRAWFPLDIVREKQAGGRRRKKGVRGA